MLLATGMLSTAVELSPALSVHRTISFSLDSIHDQNRISKKVDENEPKKISAYNELLSFFAKQTVYSYG